MQSCCKSHYSIPQASAEAELEPPFWWMKPLEETWNGQWGSVGSPHEEVMSGLRRGPRAQGWAREGDAMTHQFATEFD
jgi:hypothetical protein